MRIVTADDLNRLLTFPALIDAVSDAFRGEMTVPVRHHHTIPQAGSDATLLLMPAWTSSAEPFLGCKIVTVFPNNAKTGRPSVDGQYLLMAGDTGAPLAMIDGRALTAWRTAAASALAARHLARDDAAHLVMVGAGTLAPYLVRAHASVRPITRVTLWNRTRSKSVALGFDLAEGGLTVNVTDRLETAIRTADIVCCATLAREPLIQGAWLQEGAHLDLVGGFTPAMREADDAAVKRARIYLDTRAGAIKEAGDIADPMARGILSVDDIHGDLFDLCRGVATGRRSPQEITLFKSVGTAIEDLAAAMLVWQRLQS